MIVKILFQLGQIALGAWVAMLLWPTVVDVTGAGLAPTISYMGAFVVALFIDALVNRNGVDG